MSDWTPATTLLKYTNSRWNVSEILRYDNFRQRTVSFDYPSALYNDAMGNGLGSYTYESG